MHLLVFLRKLALTRKRDRRTADTLRFGLLSGLIEKKRRNKRRKKRNGKRGSGREMWRSEEEGRG